MPSHAKPLALPALALALAILLPAIVVAADGKPDFTGTWTFAQQKSDDLPAKIAAAVGPDYTLSNKKSEQVRTWIRSWLEGFREDPLYRLASDYGIECLKPADLLELLGYPPAERDEGNK